MSTFKLYLLLSLLKLGLQVSQGCSDALLDPEHLHYFRTFPPLIDELLHVVLGSLNLFAAVFARL